MYYVYLLKNPKSNQIYVGYSADLKQRILEHAQYEHPEWKLLYYEAYLSEKDARQRERKLKDYGASLGHLKKRIQHSLALERAGSQRNGSTDCLAKTQLSAKSQDNV